MEANKNVDMFTLHSVDSWEKTVRLLAETHWGTEDKNVYIYLMSFWKGVKFVQVILISKTAQKLS